MDGGSKLKEEDVEEEEELESEWVPIFDDEDDGEKPG